MEYCGIIITGTSGSGKTTIAEHICSNQSQFEIVKATTTRQPRNGIAEPYYSFINKAEFTQLEEGKKFITITKYRDESYGILLSDFRKVMDSRKIPILIMSPESTKTPIVIDKSEVFFLSFFIDADDNELTERLTERDGKTAQKEIASRNKDRVFKKFSLFFLLSISDKIDEIVFLINWLWDFRNTGGVIPHQILVPLVKFARLIEPAHNESISAASYDLTLGTEYFQNGKIKELTNRNPSVLINPGDFIIAQSNENVNLPSSICGRFDLTVSMFCKGLILSNGPQVDPGYNGKLFCLLFNTSNNIVELKKDKHYATIEFSKLIEPTDKPYIGKYKDKEQIFLFLPEMAKYSVTSDLKKQILLLQKELVLLKYLPIIVSLAALVIAILKLIEK